MSSTPDLEAHREHGALGGASRLLLVQRDEESRSWQAGSARVKGGGFLWPVDVDQVKWHLICCACGASAVAVAAIGDMCSSCAYTVIPCCGFCGLGAGTRGSNRNTASYEWPCDFIGFVTCGLEIEAALTRILYMA